jgi:pimeloyl-ACP methyl ester carboxylesterase
MTQAVPLRFRLQGLILVSTAMPTKAKIPVPLQSTLRTLRSAASTESKCRHASEVDKLFPKQWLDSITPRKIHELVHAVAIGRVSRGVRTAQLHLVSTFMLKPPSFLHEDPGVPVLVLHGAKDDILSYSCMKAAAARRPWTTFVSFPDAGHALFIQCEEDTVAHIRQWFAAAAAAATAAGAAAAATPSPYAATVWAASPSITWECL